MNRTDIQAVQFVDDGFPEAKDYASNYRRLPHRNTYTMRPRNLRTTLRLLRRTLRKLTTSNAVGQRLAS